MNCCSIKNKKLELLDLLTSTTPDIVMATETWLHADITNSEIFPPEYDIICKKDRNSKGGGV